MSKAKRKWYLFDTDKAKDDLTLSYGLIDTTVSAKKFAGKKLFNGTVITAGFLVTDMLPAMTINLSKQIISNDKFTEEQKERARESLASAEKYKERMRDKKCGR